MAITLEQAQAQLQRYIDAETAVLAGQRYEIEAGNGGRRSLTLANLGEIQRGIEIWSARVENATAASTGRRRSVTMAPNW